MPSPLAEAFLMGILNGCYETPSKIDIFKKSIAESAFYLNGSSNYRFY